MQVRYDAILNEYDDGDETDETAIANTVANETKRNDRRCKGAPNRAST
jgi:hypothetical protein